MADDDVLVSTDRQGCWGWAGFRLAPVSGLEATHHYAELTQVQRADRIEAAETAWLGAQWAPQSAYLWNANGPGRFEIRYRNDPTARTPLLRCACLCRVRAHSPQSAPGQAHEFLSSLMVGLPAHVRAEPFTRAVDVRDWLVPFPAPGPGESQIELVKRLSWQRTMRQDTGRNATVIVSRYSTRRISWEPALQQLAALPFPAVLTVGFEPFAYSAAFLAGLERLSGQYAMLSRPAQGSPLFDVSTPPDPFAALAARCYAQYAQHYNGPAFRVRISLAGAQALPGQLGNLLAEALSGTGSGYGSGYGSGGGPDDRAGAVALYPLPHEKALAWGNLATLGAGWLGDSFRGPLPDSLLSSLERELLTLVDLAEARSLIQLPVAWPGHPPLYSGFVHETTDPADSWGRTSSGRAVPEDEDPALAARRRRAAEKPTP